MGDGPESGGPEVENKKTDKMININESLITQDCIEAISPYLEASRAVWAGHWVRVLVLLDGCQKWAEGPRDELLGWVLVLQGEKAVQDEIEEAY